MVKKHMNKRSLVLVIDGFGIGAMNDSEAYRLGDSSANTLKTLLSEISFNDIPNLTKLGLKDLYNNTTPQNGVCTSRSKLNYDGADSYFGHQEINGSIVPKVKLQSLSMVIKMIENKLKKEGYFLRRYKLKGNEVLIVNEAVVIADNIETDHGQVINVNASFDLISYEDELKIGNIIRKIVKVSRVIVLGAHNIKLNDYLENLISFNDGYIGIDTPKSKVYNDTYMCKHLGLEIDRTNQVPYVLNKHNIPSYLIAKYGDLIDNPIKKNYFNISNTDDIISKSLNVIKSTQNRKCFIGINIQETDLSGHSMDLNRYLKTIKKIDHFIGEVLKLLNENDLLIICSDHGNDPNIGHTQHTREYVPILIYNKLFSDKYEITTRNSLNDVGSTATQWLEINLENGKSII